MAPLPGAAALKFGGVGLGGVLDDGQPVAVREVQIASIGAIWP